MPASIAAQVQAFYDRYPYPPPVDDLEPYRRRWSDPLRQRADFHLSWPSSTYRDDFSILVAGCGTSQAARYAIRWPRADVVGIDFSATSIRHTEALKRKYHLHNLALERIPLERVAELRRSFDQVICTGVLHHLPDPQAGLEALRRALTRQGAMHLMLYAPYGRSGIYLLQELSRRVGLHTSGEGLRDLERVLEALPSTHPLAGPLRESPDFQSVSALADALLHPQERAYSVPQLFEFLHAGRLQFGRWLRQAPYSAHCGAVSRIRDALRLDLLSCQEQFAVAELFRGTLMRHSLIAYRDDHPAPPHVSFHGEGWRTFVPVRIPDSVTILDRLPAGTAAILINRAHAYTDLCLPLREHEKRLLDSIDGHRTIADMIEPGCDPDAARSFFERLWWHDQIVIDSSRVDRTRPN